MSPLRLAAIPALSALAALTVGCGKKKEGDLVAAATLTSADAPAAANHARAASRVGPRAARTAQACRE